MESFFLFFFVKFLPLGGKKRKNKFYVHAQIYIHMQMHVYFMSHDFIVEPAYFNLCP